MLGDYDLYRKFKKFGKECRISDKCSVYGNVEIGDNVRIDDFCVLSGNIKIGNNVHISCLTNLIGDITIEDYAGVSMRCSVLSKNADYSGSALTNPNLPEELLNTISSPVLLKSHSLVGAGSLVLPGVTFGVGAVVGAMSLVKRDVPSWEIWAGVPIRYIKMRSTDLLKKL